MQSAEPTTSSPSSNPLFAYYNIQLPLAPRPSYCEGFAAQHSLAITRHRFHSNNVLFFNRSLAFRFSTADPFQHSLLLMTNVIDMEAAFRQKQIDQENEKSNYRDMFVSRNVIDMEAAFRQKQIDQKNEKSNYRDMFVSSAVARQRQQLGRFADKIAAGGVLTFEDVVAYTEDQFFKKFPAKPLTRKRFKDVLDEIQMEFKSHPTF
jgi:hypothetical protein